MSPPKLGKMVAAPETSIRKRFGGGGFLQNGELGSRASVMPTTARDAASSETSRTAVRKPGAAISILCAPTRSRPSHRPCPTASASIATLALTGTGLTMMRAASFSAESVSRVVWSRFTTTGTGTVPSSPSPRSSST